MHSQYACYSIANHMFSMWRTGPSAGVQHLPALRLPALLSLCRCLLLSCLVAVLLLCLSMHHADSLVCQLAAVTQARGPRLLSAKIKSGLFPGFRFFPDLVDLEPRKKFIINLHIYPSKSKIFLARPNHGGPCEGGG